MTWASVTTERSFAPVSVKHIPALADTSGMAETQCVGAGHAAGRHGCGGLQVTLVEERLAACAPLAPMESVYRWEGRVDRDSERQVVIKTSRLRLDALWERVRALHPYEVPEFIVLPIVDGNDAYLRWIGDSTGYN